MDRLGEDGNPERDRLAIEKGGPGAITLPAEVTDNLAAFHILVVQFTPISCGFIEAAGNLKVIGVLRGGTENVDVDFATDRGITVMNTPGRNARAVAECAMGMILSEICGGDVALVAAAGNDNPGHTSRPGASNDFVAVRVEGIVGQIGTDIDEIVGHQRVQTHSGCSIATVSR